MLVLEYAQVLLSDDLRHDSATTLIHNMKNNFLNIQNLFYKNMVTLIDNGRYTFVASL